MEISRNDVMLLLILALAIVSMSMVFPALGVSGDTVQADEIPTLNVTSDRVDFSGEFPNIPGSPSEYDITYKNDSDSINDVWLEGDTSGGVELFIGPPATSSTNDPYIRVNEWDAGSVAYTEELNYTSLDETNYWINESMGYKLEYTFTENNDTAGSYSATINVVAEVANAGWLSGVPLVGASIEAGQGIAAMLWWFVEVAIWAVLALVQGGGNFLLVAVDVLVYFVTLMAWLSSTYAGIVTSAPTWAGVFVALPGIVFSALLGKIILIGMQTLAQLR